MYGLVNKAIKGLLVENYGEETWERVKKDSDIEIDLFLTNQSYDDEVFHVQW